MLIRPSQPVPHFCPLRNPYWEGNATVPEVRYMPAIIRFLGYDPLPPAAAFPELQARTRRMLGLSQRKMAAKLDVDPATLMDWEAGGIGPQRRAWRHFPEFFQ